MTCSGIQIQMSLPNTNRQIQTLANAVLEQLQDCSDKNKLVQKQLSFDFGTCMIHDYFSHQMVSFSLPYFLLSQKRNAYQSLVNPPTQTALISAGHTRLPTASATDKMTRIYLISSSGWSSPGVTETGAGTISGIRTFTTASGTPATGKRTPQTKRGYLTVMR